MTSRPIGHDAGDAGQSVNCSMAIITRSDFDWGHEMSSKSLAIDSKGTGFIASPGTKNDMLLSSKASQTSALIQSIIHFPYRMLLRRSLTTSLATKELFHSDFLLDISCLANERSWFSCSPKLNDSEAACASVRKRLKTTVRFATSYDSLCDR